MSTYVDAQTMYGILAQVNNGRMRKRRPAILLFLFFFAYMHTDG